MKTYPSEALEAGRDPVSTAVDECLRMMESNGLGVLERNDEHGAVRLRFGHHSAYADTYETALMRLVGEMLEDLRYRPALVNVLREKMGDAP